MEAINSELSNYVKQCTKVTVEELYSNPKRYNGMDVAVTAWNAYYGLIEPVKSESYYQLYLINDRSRFLGNNKLSSAVDAEKYPSIFVYVYYSDYIEPYHTPYVDAIIYNKYIDEVINSRENKITVYGKFTYNPAYDEGGYVADPKPYQIEVYEYQLQ
ncbi:hypothetical protein IZU99_10565 [Oscillospiraceae bacterium CM]|nr:hypothetical protein IZU99_10565 [Oscillospiraceae bacterium CM]